jgi:RHS repeat-associated protein
VSVGRRVGTGSNSPFSTDRPFGQWDLDIPHVHGVFSASKGWTSEGAASNRCSTFGAPASAVGTSNGSTWESDEFWAGNFLYVPGAGDQQMLLRDGANTRSPAYPAAPTLYPIVTRGLWSISCLPALKNASVAKVRTGEGFLAISPDGTKYQFDWMVAYQAPTLFKSLDLGMMSVSARASAMSDASVTARPEEPAPEINVQGVLARNEVWILPSRVTDRHGNYVDYAYDAVVPENLKSITSNDGRSLTFTYVPGASGPTRQIQTVSEVTSAGTRTWTYSYIKTGTFANVIELEKVTLPDMSVLNVYGARSLFKQVNFTPPPGCDDPSGAGSSTYLTGTMTHPSGASGKFSLTPTLHGRSNVVRDCRLSGQSAESAVEVNLRPRYFTTMSLTSKEISGPGIAPSVWSYDYGPPNASWACGIGCPSTKVVTVTDPAGDKTVQYFGNRIDETEGQLQRTDVYDGETLLRSTFLTYQPPGNNPYPRYLGYQSTSIGDADQLRQLSPVKQQLIRQQGVDFIMDVNEFDVFGRAKDVTRRSSPGIPRREVTTYLDKYPTWLLGMVEKVTHFDTGTVMVANTYNATTSNLETVSKFGKLQQTLAYNADGTISSVKDEKNPSTSFATYVRGIPKLITFADGTKLTHDVDTLGNIRSVTDQNLITTAYAYDAMNRVKVITPPAGGAVAWNSTTIDYAQVQSYENDVGPGHWKQTVSMGNSVEVVLFDALMRRVQTYKYDRNNEAATSRFSKSQFDINGNQTFSAFPVRSFSAVGGGVRTEYDALGRVTAVRTDSELGVLNSTNTYGVNFTTTSVNPRNFATTSSFQTFDTPSESAVAVIKAPESVNVDIVRDIFGKPTSVTRSGLGKSATRTYVYDANHRLCKTVEPETGATIQDYDLANNVKWRASGLAMPSTTSCDTLSIPNAKKISFAYDVLNRLETTAYGDLSPGISRTYWPDGLPKTVNSNGANWTYTYNARRLIDTENLEYGGLNYVLRHGYDANTSKTSLTYPDNAVVSYLPNALGEPTQVGAFAGGITYYPNGAIKTFTYGNGVLHTLTQNTCGLPNRSIDAGVLNDEYAFDENGNVTAIGDWQEAVSGRAMTYDGLDRLKQVYAPSMWGNASFDYDALDNLVISNFTDGVGAQRAMMHNYPDGTNRLMSVTGTASFAVIYAYDSQGNIIQRGTQAFVFDQGNRVTQATGKATYVYDGLGRRSSIVTPDGVNRLQMYSQDGKLMFAGPTSSTKTKYIYLQNHVLAEVNGTSTEYLHTDGLGSPIARTNAVGLVSRTRYEPYGRTAAGATPTIGFTGHVNDVDTGLTYMQQRYYDPVAGRFLSIDPVTTDANTGGSFNRYAYAENNPYKYVDPDGRDAKKASDPCAGKSRMSCGTLGTITVSSDPGTTGARTATTSVASSNPKNVTAYFNDMYPPIHAMAARMGTDENFIFTLSSMESGWLDQHNRDLFNPYGLTKAGGNNLQFSSFDAATTYFEKSSQWGSRLKGISTIDGFIKELLTPPKYNSVNPNYEQIVRQQYQTIIRRKAIWEKTNEKR